MCIHTPQGTSFLQAASGPTPTSPEALAAALEADLLGTSASTAAGGSKSQGKKKGKKGKGKGGAGAAGSGASATGRGAGAQGQAPARSPEEQREAVDMETLRHALADAEPECCICMEELSLDNVRFMSCAIRRLTGPFHALCEWHNIRRFTSCCLLYVSG